MVVVVIVVVRGQFGGAVLQCCSGGGAKLCLVSDDDRPGVITAPLCLSLSLVSGYSPLLPGDSSVCFLSSGDILDACWHVVMS